VLTEEKIIERIIEMTPFTSEVEKLIKTIVEDGTKELLRDAIA